MTTLKGKRFSILFYGKQVKQVEDLNVTVSKGRLAENRDIVSLCQPTLSPHSTTHLFTNYPQLPFPSLTLSLPKSTPIPNLNPLSLPYHYLPPIVKANSSYIPGTMPRLMEQNYLHPTWNQPQNWTPPAPLILS